MSENNYVERGSATVGNNLENGSIAQPNDPTKRKVKFEVTSGGNLRGFVQPSGHQEEIALKAAKKKMARQEYEPDTPAYADFGYAEYADRDGVIKHQGVFIYNDIEMADGNPLAMKPGEVLLFNHLDELEGDEPIQGERAAFSGYAADLQGNLTIPALWRRGSGKEVFYGGDNQAFDREAYLEAKGQKKQETLAD